MKAAITFALIAGLLSTPTNAIQLHERTDGPPRVVGFPLQRKSIPDPVSRDRLRRRSDTLSVSLYNGITLYYANASLGTPSQSFRLHIDTGSSDLWVNSPSSVFCTSSGSPCALSGTYIANSSSTYSYIASDFNITYVDGSGSSGDYVTDTFTIGGATLSELQFGIGYTSSSDEGILGIGYQINEVQVGRAGRSAYNNLPAQLVADGKIQSNAYSLWLNDLNASTGNILFGGVDTSRYQGTLETLPVQKESGVYAEFFITLTQLTYGSTALASNQALAVLLDSGSSLTYLPTDITTAIYEQVGGEYDSSLGVAYVPCSLASSSNTLDFTFSSPTISIAMKELVISLGTGPGAPTMANGAAACLFGIAPSDSTSALGDTFLRSAYVVYDLSNNEISLAQTNFNSTSSNIVEIGTGTSSVPDASVVTSPVAAASGLNSQGGVTTIVIGTHKSAAVQRAPPAILSVMAAVGAGILYAAM